MKKPSVLLFALLSTLALFGCRNEATAESGADSAVKADFRLKTVDGRTLGPKDFAGQVVVIDFWATWCGPCHIQARILEPLYREYKGRGVQFLAANIGEDAATVKGFLREKPIPYPVLLDPEDTVSGKLGIQGLPTLMVVDKKGKVSYFRTGLADGETLRKAIKQAGA
jgi:thiol-disulfide isomerase/thioredoxin